ncbi:MAG: alpha/beta hydrolase [Chitinophagaceae bacterium]
MKTIKIDEQTKIAYSQHGSHMNTKDCVVLFIHGIGNYHGVWNTLISQLPSELACISIDLPGNGFSSRTKVKYDINYYTSCIFEFIKKMGFKKVVLAGHSMGGMIALSCALKKPSWLHKLVLFAPAGFEKYTPSEATLYKSAISFGNFLNLDEIQIQQSIQAAFYTSHSAMQPIIDDLKNILQGHNRVDYRAMLEECIHSMLDTDLFDSLKDIQTPTLVFFGENDMLIPNRFLHPVSTKEIAVKGSAQIPYARLITYPLTGHFVQIEQAMACAKEMLHFIFKN